MTKVYGQLAMLGLMVASLSACQSIDTARVKYVKETTSTESNALIFCAGTEQCEFERLDETQIIDAQTHRLSRQAIQQGIVRLKEKSLNDPNPLFLSVPTGQHEVVIRFYPISKDRAETLHVFHNFNAKKHYTFKMYRDRSKHTGSLLNVSAPDPLCVDLQQAQKSIRRFCKPYNVLNGLGEFVEQKI
ncbi:hypothetical protein [Acinetobacter bouvetii]|uniref:Lipoprotein n=1 Tax=Acinetobacter bouvetii TaxID=202951 RepID=A0A811GFD8_9GAMM|nr:hypothetical protein [Acinetobacter bouvetii]CAB1208431.1 hypothetical protein SFB21_0402 [Acinetobacter bouvetii]